MFPNDCPSRNELAAYVEGRVSEHELEAVGRLDHPHIVRATDAGEFEGTWFLAMDFVDGLDLNELVGRLGPLPIADACELIRQAALGVQHAHEHGLIHRDIKPSNLMLAKNSADRYPTAAAVAAALRTLSGGHALGRLLRIAVKKAATEPGVEQVPSGTISTSVSALSNTTDIFAGPHPMSHNVPTRRRLLGSALAGGLLLALSSVVIYLHTGEGELQLTINEPNTKVRIDGEPPTITVQSPNGKLTITVPSGKHTLEVSNVRFSGYTHEFRVTRNGTAQLSAVLVPRLVPDPGRITPTSQPATSGLEKIIDDGDAGYSERIGKGLPGWQNGTSDKLNQLAYGHNDRSQLEGGLSALWTFKDLPAGDYRVWATWPSRPDRAGRAVFNVYDGEVRHLQTYAEQRVAPDDEHAGNCGWKRLGTCSIQSGTLIVELDGKTSTGGSLVADAVRIVRLDKTSGK